MTKNGLALPMLRVQTQDGAEWEVQPLPRDQMDYELFAIKRKWPDFRAMPVTWQSFLAYQASRREGLIPPAVGWEQFRNEVLAAVTGQPPAAAEDQDEDEEADPADVPFTGPAPGTG